MKQLTELEFFLIDFMNNDNSVEMKTWDSLWNKIGKKFGTKEAIDIYNEGCQQRDCPETEQEFIESYMRY